MSDFDRPGFVISAHGGSAWLRVAGMNGFEERI